MLSAAKNEVAIVVQRLTVGGWTFADRVMATALNGRDHLIPLVQTPLLRHAFGFRLDSRRYLLSSVARFARKKFCRIWRHSDSRIPVVIMQVWLSGGICNRLIIPPAAPVLGSGQPKITRRIRE